MINALKWLNENIVWGVPALIMFGGTGLLFTFRLKGFQFNIAKLFRDTVLAPKKLSGNDKVLSPFQSLTAVLAVTLGTGNIAAVGTAIENGGAGAVFWLWVSAFLGMATSYSENFLGIKHRIKNADGSYKGGAFFYIEKVLGSFGGMFFAVCCLMTAFGMGGMTQTNSMTSSLKNAFGLPVFAGAIIAAVVSSLLIWGGAVIMGQISEKFVPVMALVYIGGCLAVIAMKFTNLPMVFAEIFTQAFNFKSMGVGIAAGGAVHAMSWGFRRGIFSNEAGLGSTVIFNSMSAETSAEKQGKWASLAVFIDTIVICTLTALVILTTRTHLNPNIASGNLFAANAFTHMFGGGANMFVSVCLSLFALTTMTGWSIFGKVCVNYIFGEGILSKLYPIVFVGCVFIGGIAKLDLVWQLADLSNGLMAVPNLVSLLLLRKSVVNSEPEPATEN